jgi:hypothetical protein
MAQEVLKVLTALDKKADSKADATAIDKAVATDAKVTGTGDNRYVTTEKVNIKSGATSSSNSQLPLATQTDAGLMASGDVRALAKVVQDVESLKGSTKIWYIDLSGATDPSNPTQAELQDAYEDVSGQVGEANDGTTIRDEVTGQKWIWSETAQEWKLDSTPPIANFSAGAAGLIVGTASDIDAVSGSPTEGKELNGGRVYAENDGTGSVLGWGELKGRVEDVESAVDSLEQTVTGSEDDIGDLKTDVAALNVQVFDKNTPFLGAVGDYAALIAKLTAEGYYV